MKQPLSQKSFLNHLNAFWSKLPVRHRGAVVIAIPAMCLVLTLAAWVWSRYRAMDAQAQADHAEAIIATSDRLLMELINVETGTRGYGITLDTAFLAPYNQALEQLPLVFNDLEKMVQTQPDQYQRLQEIKRLAERRIDYATDLIKVVRLNNRSAVQLAQTQDLTRQGRGTMEDIRTQVQTFQRQERRSLISQQQTIQDVRNLTGIMLWFTAVISGLGSLAALYLFRYVDFELQNRDLSLQEITTLLGAVLSNAVDGVIMLDESGKIELFNPTASAMFGYEPQSVQGQDLEFLLDETQNGFQLNQPWKTRGKRRDGSFFPIQISISETALTNRLIAIIRDITAFQEAEAKLQARADELSRLTTMLAQTNTVLENRNRELEQFAYVASHDLKAPLRAIANLSEWIEEDLADRLPDENQNHMRLLRGRVHRMEALINGLLEYSRVGRMQAQPEPVDITSLLHEVVDSLAPPASFAIEIQPDMPTLKTRRLPLRQVFANLIGNAIKHHPRMDGCVQIRCTDRGNCYEFSVTDNGQGIAPEYHNKIFSIFQTLYPRDTKENTGIGLAIVKKIVETEGGTIRIESQEGEGTTFYFTWLKHLHGT